MRAPSRWRVSLKRCFVKRLAFTEEHEVRLLFIPHETEDAKGDLFSYAVAPHALIDQVMIDPRMSVTEALPILENHLTPCFQLVV